jgi:hypothetical protein
MSYHPRLLQCSPSPPTFSLDPRTSRPTGLPISARLAASVTAKRGDTAYGICSTNFLEQAFRTDRYRCDITFNDDGSWSCLIETELLVRGAPFNHRDSNTLTLVAPPRLNPLAVIVNDRARREGPAA